VIAKESPAAELESDKSQPPVGHSDPDRIEKVRTLFDQRAAYLDRRQLDIRLRRETVDRVVQGKQYSEILDIGCGGRLYFNAAAKFPMPPDSAGCVAGNAFHCALSRAGGIVVAGKIRESGFHGGAI